MIKVIIGCFCAVSLFSCAQHEATVVSTVASLTPPPVSDTSKMLGEQELILYRDNAPSIKPNPSNGDPFGHLQYDKIIAYDFEGQEESIMNPIDEKGRFVSVILKQQVLTQLQADNILQHLSDVKTYGGTSAACFNPHLGLVFFKDNQVVSQISICLDCNLIDSKIPIPAVTYKKIDPGTDNEYSLVGFSTSGRKAIIELGKELGFYYGTLRAE